MQARHPARSAGRPAPPSWAGGFVGLSALAVPAWWLALYRSPAAREVFIPPEAWRGFQAVLMPDLLLALACAIVAVRLWQGRSSRALVGAICGAWAYATAYSLAWALAVGAPWPGPTLMVAALAGFAKVWHGLVSTRQTGDA